MSIPTSIVVVHDKTSTAVASCLRVIVADVDVLEEKFVLFSLGVDILRLGGVQLCRVFGSDERHWRSVFRRQRLDGRATIVALTS